MVRKDKAGHNHRDGGFTLVEVIISLVILGIGVMSLLRLFPLGVQVSVLAERSTNATLLAEEMIESMKAMGAGGMVRVIPGSFELVPMPGDGMDTDNDTPKPSLDPDGEYLFSLVDANKNGKIDSDFDGWPEKDFQMDFVNNRYYFNEYDDDVDGIADDDGDSGSTARRVPYRNGEGQVGYSDGDLSYDPEFFYYFFGGEGFGADEEFPDGEDNDGDGLIDEDVRLASDVFDNGRWLFPLRPGNGLDDDGDGEKGSPLDDKGRAIADGIDNNKNGLIDEGIDEEVFNGRDDDGDGKIDEDCRAACYPFCPRKFPGLDASTVRNLGTRGTPFEATNGPQWPDRSNRFGWQIQVGRVPDGGGDGIDNDGDGAIDEERFGFDPRSPVPGGRNGLDDDGDGLIDEDCGPAPVRGFRKITVLITWGGDGDQNNDGAPGIKGVDDDGDDGTDFEDLDILAGMEFDAVQMLGYESLDDVPENVMHFLKERWAMDDDEDGRIDEEKKNGIDDDLDGLVDEDTYGNFYSVTTILRI